MKRIEINCQGIPNAMQVIKDAGFTILPSPNIPDDIQVEGEPADLAKLRNLLRTLGKATYQELDNGRRTVKTAPTAFRVHRNKIAVGSAIAAAASAAAYFLV